MIRNLTEHCSQLVNKQFKNSSSGGENYTDLLLDGDCGLIISESDSDAAVNEDDKFRLSVPPIARAIKQLITDLHLAFAKVKNMDRVNKNNNR